MPFQWNNHSLLWGDMMYMTVSEIIQRTSITPVYSYIMSIATSSTLIKHDVCHARLGRQVSRSVVGHLPGTLAQLWCDQCHWPLTGQTRWSAVFPLDSYYIAHVCVCIVHGFLNILAILPGSVSNTRPVHVTGITYNCFSPCMGEWVFIKLNICKLTLIVCSFNNLGNIY